MVGITFETCNDLDSCFLAVRTCRMVKSSWNFRCDTSRHLDFIFGAGLFCAVEFHHFEVFGMVVLHINEIFIIVLIIISAGVLFFFNRLALLGATDGLWDEACSLVFVVIAFHNQRHQPIIMIIVITQI